MQKRGFIYIMSVDGCPDVLKLGMSKNPEIRARQLSSETAAVGEFKVEWAGEVPNMEIAERILHDTFRQFHKRSEFFRIEINHARRTAIYICKSLWKVADDAKKVWILELEVELKNFQP
ncbi:MAG TPA: GIY-YIG nuclease family protein [Chryseolinea sp.]|nr:GIY-YIG nuclease family protein [Chryseolinea sp.]